jgi:diphthamide biosynthesis methyltransferase
VEAILEEALTADVAFLVVGDPFAATTHADLQLRAKCERRKRYIRTQTPPGFRAHR